MKYSHVFMLVCFLGLSSLKPGDRCIRWLSTRPLTWGDFQGQPDDLENAAVTSAFISKTPYRKNPLFIYAVACFDKQKSWVVAPDSLGLIHEQGHFDIVEIFARKFNNEFNNAKMNIGEKDLHIQRKRFDEIDEEMVKVQVKYDKETQGSYNEPEQIRWNKWIKKQLDSIPQLQFE